MDNSAFYHRDDAGFSRSAIFAMKLLLTCFLLICLFCSLGVWQLYRYHFKRDLVLNYQIRASSPVQPFTAKTVAEFQRIHISGHYLPQWTVILHGQFYHDQLGDRVFVPFQMNGENKLLLVDRGWVRSFVNEKLPKNQTGYIKFMNEYHFILGKNILNGDHAPFVLQKIDFHDLERVIHHEFFPYVLRLEHDPLLVMIQPERHLGYAMQWFCFALIVLIGYFLLLRARQ